MLFFLFPDKLEKYNFLSSSKHMISSNKSIFYDYPCYPIKCTLLTTTVQKFQFFFLYFAIFANNTETLQTIWRIMVPPVRDYFVDITAWVMEIRAIDFSREKIKTVDEDARCQRCLNDRICDLASIFEKFYSILLVPGCNPVYNKTLFGGMVYLNTNNKTLNK